MMTHARQNTGFLGEEAAAAHLLSLGYAVLERNWECKVGELDIIAKDNGTLVFTEVKTFSPQGFYEGPVVNITPRKMQQVIRAAQFYLMGQGAQRLACRFDVVAVRLHMDGTPAAIEHFKGAFTQ
jgi:putative endonuclease